MKSRSEAGDAHAIVIVGLVVALVVALGWIFWQNFAGKETVKNGATSQPVGQGEAPQKEQTSAPTVTYHDFRTAKKDGTGIVVKSEADIAALTDVGDDLKAYFAKDAGTEVDTMDGKTKQAYTVDRLHGNYAAGTQANGNVYSIWGPKDGAGVITSVAGTQNGGFSCDVLKAAKVPSELVDNTCMSSDGSGSMVNYRQD